MQVEIQTEIVEAQVGDLIVIKWTHMPYKWVGQITKTSANENAYLHGLDGRSQFYRTRGFKTLQQLFEHMKASRSVQTMHVIPQSNYKLQVIAKEAK